MPRRIFTPRDLGPIRLMAEKLMEREPDAVLVAGGAGPFKRRIPRPDHEERREVGLPVDIRSSSNPDGVPLHEIVTQLREEAPGLTGVSVTPGGLSLQFKRAPTATQRKKIDQLLGDQARLEKMRPPPEKEPHIRKEILAMATEGPEGELRQVLQDPQTSDAAWMKAFRTFATEHLIGPSDRRPER